MRVIEDHLIRSSRTYNPGVLTDFGERYGRFVIENAMTLRGVEFDVADADQGHFLKNELCKLLLICRDQGMSREQAERFTLAYLHGVNDRIAEFKTLLTTRCAKPETTGTVSA